MLITLFTSSSAFAAADPTWEVVSSEENVIVSKAAIPGTPVVGLKGETIVAAPMAKILHVIADPTHDIDWVDRVKETKVLRQVSQWNLTLYQSYSLPWPFKDRDFVFNAVATKTPDGKVKVIIKSIDDPLAPETLGVRGKIEFSSYLLTPLGNEKTKVEVEVLTDPMGDIPKWLVNLIQKDWPRETLNGIKEQVKKSYIREYPLPP